MKQFLLFCLYIIFSAQIVCASSAPGLSFSTQVHGDIYGQPKVIEDVDGDGVRDIIFGATDGKVHIVSGGTGEEIFRPPFWPKQTGGPILSDVQLADLTGDGRTEVIVSSQDGKVYCLNHLGRELWTVDTRGKLLVSPPEIADIDGNGVFNVLVGSNAGTVSRIDPMGRLVWEIRQTTSVSAAVVARDINGNGVKEIITKDDNGNVVILQNNGIPMQGWPKQTAPNMTWPFDVDANDVTGDGMQEIFTTTPDRRFIMWSHDGQKMTEFPLTDGAHTAPVLADVNGNGRDEFIIAQADGTISVTDSRGNSLSGWPFQTGHAIYHAPRLIDINGDGNLNIVFTAWDPAGEGSQAGYIMALSRDGTVLSDFPKYIGKTIAPLTFADLNNNGYLEMIAAGGINYTDKQLHVFPTRARNRVRIAVLGQEVNYE